MIESLKTILPRDWVRDEWSIEMYDWGERVRLFRDYYDGNHRARLTENMKNMLRVTGSQYDQFNENYCPLVVDTFADRLIADDIVSGDPTVDQFVQSVLRRNRWDGLQMDIHDAAIRDGDTFALVEYDSQQEAVVIHHEPCWDGDTGMLVVYDRQLRNIIAAIKVWYEGAADARRVNVYYSDRVEKYRADETGYGLLPFVDEDTDENGRVDWLVGQVPVVHYRNRVRSRERYGVSELASVVPLQDALNRGLMSMVMVSELTAFAMRVAKGFEPPDEISPGMWVTIAAEGLSRDQVADAYTLEAGGIVPFIDQANHIVEQISTISRTPLGHLGGSDAVSGESLKQRESGLLAKVRRAQVRFGNVHEDLLALAIKVYNVYGESTIGDNVSLRCVWRDAEVRNDAEQIANAMMTRDILGDRETVRLLANVYGFTVEDQERILTDVSNQTRMN